MPCNSDYLDQNASEAALQQAAKLLVYVCGRLAIVPNDWMIEQADKTYADDERSVPELCRLLNGLNPRARDALIYGDAKDKMARQLADWWEEHEAHDKQLREIQRKERDKKVLKKSALSKLTPAERKALGY